MLIAALIPAAATADETTQTIVLYVLGIGIDGQARAGPLEADIDVSASEVFDHLEFGAMGSYRWDSDPWSFQLDAMYASLAAEQAGSRELARATLDLDQTMIEVDAGYQLTKNLQVLAGARYWDIETEIAVHGSGPSDIVRRSSGGNSWTDPLIGLRVVVPIGEHWAFIARGDVGGFGVGADVAWHATAFFDWHFGESLSMVLGYRIFDLEFDEGRGDGRFELDLQESGPGIGIAYSF